MLKIILKLSTSPCQRNCNIYQKGEKIISRELSYCKSLLLYSTNLNITSNTIQTENNSNSNFINIDDTIILAQDFNEMSESSISDTESLSDRQNYKKYNVEIQNYVFNISNDLSDCNKKSLREDLQKLIVEQNIAHNTANELLAILRKHGHVDLPKDVRVLLKTPRNGSANIKSLGNSNYIHFGISFTLKRSIQIYS